MSLEAFNLEGAEAAYVVANTPMYLIRRLREDQAVRAIAKAVDGAALLNIYKEQVSRFPSDLREMVTPSVCLVALSIARALKELREATTVGVSHDYKWIDEVANILVETYRPLSRQHSGGNLPTAHPWRLSSTNG